MTTIRAGRFVFVTALLLLGTCGSAAGLVAGFGFARGVSRSLIQLSVLIRDAAGRLDEGVEPVTFSGSDLGELENVLRLIAEGLSNAAIAERLVLSEKTVKSHVRNILGKLHLVDRTQAAIFAWRQGLMGS